MPLNIKYWDPSKMRPGAVLLIIGRRGSGKSTLMEDLLSYRRLDLKRGVCVSATERSNEFWGKHIPKCMIHHEYSDSITRDLFRMQKKIKAQTGRIEPAFAIFDDLLFDKSFVKSKYTRQIFMNGRHHGLFTIVSAQYIMDVPPGLRANIDYVLCLQDNIRTNRERVYNYFAGMFEDFGSFDECMKACTENNEAMVLDQTSLSYKISDCVYFYKATPGLYYKIGDAQYWAFDQKQRPSKDSDDEEDGARPSKRQNNRIYKRYPTYYGGLGPAAA